MKEDNSKDPLDPIEKTSYACGVCGALKDGVTEARECALSDTRKIEVDKVMHSDKEGYVTKFKGKFRTEVCKTFAEVEECRECNGTGEVVKTPTPGGVEGTYPCTGCNATGWVVKKQK